MTPRLARQRMSINRLHFVLRDAYLATMGIVIRMIVFGLVRRLLGLPGMIIVGGLLYLYWQTNFGGW